VTLAEIVDRRVEEACAEVRARYAGKIATRMQARIKRHGRMVREPTERMNQMLTVIVNAGGVDEIRAMRLNWATLGGLLARGAVRRTQNGRIVAN
jgi:hypothetical protein